MRLTACYGRHIACLNHRLKETNIFRLFDIFRAFSARQCCRVDGMPLLTPPFALTVTLSSSQVQQLQTQPAVQAAQAHSVQEGIAKVGNVQGNQRSAYPSNDHLPTQSIS